MRGDDPGHKKCKALVFFPVFLCPPKIGRCILGLAASMVIALTFTVSLMT